MAYLKPGVYARFVPTPTAVQATTGARTLALVGTGITSYSVQNEIVTRSSNSISDALANPDVFQLQYLTSAPLKNGVPTAGTLYAEGTQYTLEGGQYIVWASTGTASASIDAASMSPFKNLVTVTVDSGTGYLVETAQYKVEITYIDGFTSDNPNLGTYRIINLSTNEVIGEYACSPTPLTGAIPGVDLTISTTFSPLATPVTNPDGSQQSATQLGDYVIIDTTAAQISSSAFISGATPTAPPAPTAGQAIYATYSYRKAPTDFIPKLFYNYSDVVAEYGNYDVTASGVVVNSLSLAAQIAVLNGVSPIVCMQTQSESTSQMMAAIDQLQVPIAGVSNYNTIIPLTTNPTVGAYAQAHVNLMSSEDEAKERMTYLGSPSGLTYTGYASGASSYNDRRVVYVVPGAGAVMSVTDINTGIASNRTVPAPYLAVAVASLALSQDPAEPLTNKTIKGFVSLAQLFSESQMNAMAAAGCLVLTQDAASNIIVRHGITTATDNVNDQEITLVQIEDYVIQSARTSLAPYIGSKYTPTIVSNINVTLTSLLDQLQASSIILSYSSLQVVPSNVNPTEIDVSFIVSAVYPLNYIEISFSFSQLSTSAS